MGPQNAISASMKPISQYLLWIIEIPCDKMRASRSKGDKLLRLAGVIAAVLGLELG
jgi:hypothetical protein